MRLPVLDAGPDVHQVPRKAVTNWPDIISKRVDIKFCRKKCIAKKRWVSMPISCSHTDEEVEVEDGCRGAVAERNEGQD